MTFSTTRTRLVPKKSAMREKTSCTRPDWSTARLTSGRGTVEAETRPSRGGPSTGAGAIHDASGPGGDPVAKQEGEDLFGGPVVQRNFEAERRGPQVGQAGPQAFQSAAGTLEQEEAKHRPGQRHAAMIRRLPGAASSFGRETGTDVCGRATRRPGRPATGRPWCARR